jgi:hypothetical protein
MVLAQKTGMKTNDGTIKDPEVKPHCYSYMIFDNGSKREKRASSTSCAGKTCYLLIKE